MARWLTAAFWREHLLLASYGIWGLFLFLVFLISSFPYQDALSGALSPAGLTLSYEDQHFHFPIGAEMDNVRLVRLGDSGAPLLQSSLLRVAPSLGTIVLRPGLSVRAEAYNGVIHAILRRLGEGMQASLVFNDLDLDRYKPLSQMGVTLAGTISGDGSLLMSSNDLLTADGDIQLRGENLSLRPGLGLPPIPLTHLTAKAKLDHGLVTISDLKGDGPDLKIAGNGVIRLMPNIATSMVQLTLHLDPTPAGRTRLGFLFGLLPHPPNSTPYIVHGPITFPSVT